MPTLTKDELTRFDAIWKEVNELEWRIFEIQGRILDLKDESTQIEAEAEEREQAQP